MAYTIIDNDCVRRDADGALVPNDPDNRDRAEYEAWLAAGNAPSPPPLERSRAERLASLADRRRRAESAGTSVGGMSIATDAASQSKLTAAVVASVLDNDYRVRWKLADGSFAPLDHASLIAVARAVRVHVQACFDREAALAALIRDAGDAAAIAAIDIDAGWPG